MSYQEKNITVSLTSYLLILGFYLVSMVQSYQDGSLNSAKIFSLWITVILTLILVTIVASILTNIMLSIVEAIKNKGVVSERFIADERDKLFDLRGIKFSYITFSIGVFLAMLTFVLGQPPLVMFSVIVFFSILSQLVGDISRLYYYRRGF